MNCPRCYNPFVPDHAASCPQCGAPIDQTAKQYGRLCPSGKHQMDPNWKTCAFCDSEAAGAGPRPTVDEKLPAPTVSLRDVNASVRGTASDQALPVIPAPFSARKTVVDSTLMGQRPAAPPLPPQPEPPRAANKTLFMSQSQTPEPAVASAAPATPAPAMGSGARIVAVMVCHSNLLNPSGAIFPVREGRNKIGADPASEIAFPQDPTMSGWNASVTYRDGKYYLSAKDSMNGTYLNGVEVPPDSTCPLPNYATLRAGATTFKFIMVEPVETPAA